MYGCSTLWSIGQCVGAQDLSQIKLNYKRIMAWGYLAHGIAAALVVLFRFQLLGIYNNLSPETVELAADLVCIHLIPAIALYPLSFLITGPLRAANDSAFPMWVSIFSMVIFRLSLAQILCVELEMGAVGVWLAMLVDWVCRSICFTVRWHSGAWKKKCTWDHKQVPAPK